jgi:hypothetical protein
MRRVGRDLSRVGALLLVLGVVGPVSSALAESPHVTIAVPSLNPETPTIKGEAGLVSEGDNPDVSVAVFHRGGSEVGSASVPVEQFSREWEYKPPTLSDGEYEVVAIQGNEFGETGEARAVFKVEATPPTVTISVSSPKPEPRPTLEGSAGTAESVSVTITGKLTNGETFKGITEGAQVSGGHWSYAVTSPGLADGTYVAEATGTTKSGAKASAHASFTINTPLPIVTLSTTTFVQREKAELATNATPSFTGTAATGPEDSKSVTVNVYKGTTPTGTPVKVPGTVNGTTWKAAVPSTAALAGGTYTAAATQEDEAKNIGTSAPVTFTVDATPPAVTLTEPAGNHEFHVAKLPFKGAAGVASGDLPSVSLNIYEGSSVSGKLADKVPIPPSGASWAITGPGLANGTYTAQAEQNDDVGNVGKSTPVTFTIAMTSPAVTLNTLGLVLRGPKLVSGPSPSFNGTAGTAPEDESVVVNLYPGTSASGSVVEQVTATRSGTSWTAGPVAALPEGIYTAQAEQAAHAPDVNGFSKSSTFTVDATPPHITLTSPANGSSTASGSELVTGSAGNAEGDLPEVTVQLFSGTGVGGPLLQSLNVSGVGGAWSATIAGLGPGTYTVRAEQADDVGNLGMSPTATFVVTKTPPPTVATGSYLSQPPMALTGAVNPNGGEVSGCYFEYGNTPLYGTTVPCSELPGSGTVVVEVSAPISGLAVGGIYHFRIVAANAGGTSRGADQTFVVAQSSPEGPSAPTAATTPRTLIVSPAQGVLPSQEHKPPPVPDVELASTALGVSPSGTVSIKVTCPTGESRCIGTIMLRTLTAVSAATGHLAKRRILTLAAGAFTVAGGQTTTVKLRLSTKARKLLSRTHVLRARATINAHDPLGATHTTQTIVTLRWPKTAHGRRKGNA